MGNAFLPNPPRRAFTLVELLVVIGIIALLIAILLPSLNRAREGSNRVKCAANLRSIGQALLAYAHENRGAFPRTYFEAGKPLIDAQPPFTQLGAGAASPFGGSRGFVGTNNAAAPLFLLLRTQNLSAEVFLCPSSQALRDNFGGGSNSAQNRSNFTKLPDNLAYSYANPYPDLDLQAEYKLGKALHSEFAVAADLNPGRLAGRFDVTLPKDHREPPAILRQANSANHNAQGQNVLFADGHVDFAQTPFVGMLFDNIYTQAAAPDGAGPTSANLVGPPRWRGDSVLLPIGSSQ